MDAALETQEQVREGLRASDAARRRGDHQEGAALAEAAATRAERAGEAALAAEAWLLLAAHRVRLGDLQAAVAAGGRAVAHFSVHGPPAALSKVHAVLSNAYTVAGLNSAGMTHASQALRAARQAVDTETECWALIRLATALDEPPGGRRSVQMFGDALALARRLQQPEAIFTALNNPSRRWVVEADRLAERGEDARPALLQALALAEQASGLASAELPVFSVATAQANLGGIHRRLGHWAEARRYLGQALATAGERQYAGLAATLRLALACLDFEETATAATRQALAEALEAPDNATADAELRLQARRQVVRGCSDAGEPALALAQMERLHAEALASRERRADLQSRLLFSQAELDQARHEAEVQRLRADTEHRWARTLEAEVAARTAELERARAAAESASRAKSSFLSIVSHELRTPLNGLIGMVHLARRRAVEVRQQEQLDTAAEAARRLSDVFDNILQYVAADAAAPPVPVATDLRTLLAQVLHSRDPAAAAKGLELRLEVADALPAQVQVDGDHLARIAQALLDNAVKFSPGGQVRLQVLWTAAADGVGALRLQVVDQGPGLDPAVVDRLFRPFEMGDASSTRSHGGLGLGLALAQRLAQGLGGEVGVSSTPGQGSTFWVALTVEPA